MSIPRKDPATDSIHFITCKQGDDVLDPSTWDGFVVHAYRPNGEIIARFSLHDIAGYAAAEVVGVRIKILMKAEYTRHINNEQIYCKVFRQADDGNNNLVIGPEMSAGKYVLIELDESQISEFPEMSNGSASS